jgi:ABC-type Fe3+-siderophore transport system permease subunit
MFLLIIIWIWNFPVAARTRSECQYHAIRAVHSSHYPLIPTDDNMLQFMKFKIWCVFIAICTITLLLTLSSCTSMWSTYLFSIAHYNNYNKAKFWTFHSLMQSELRFHYMFIYVILLVNQWTACAWSNVNTLPVSRE